MFRYDRLVPTDDRVKRSAEEFARRSAVPQADPGKDARVLLAESDDEDGEEKGGEDEDMGSRVVPRLKPAKNKMIAVVTANEWDIELLEPTSSTPGVTIGVLTNPEALKLMEESLRKVGRHATSRSELQAFASATRVHCGMGAAPGWEAAVAKLRQLKLASFQVATLVNTWPWVTAARDPSLMDVEDVVAVLRSLKPETLSHDTLLSIVGIGKELLH